MNIRKTAGAALDWLHDSILVRWIMAFVIMGVFGIVLYPNIIVSRHQYSLGDVAERDIKSPRGFLIEDKIATEKKRQQAREDVLTVYDLDTSLAPKIRANVSEAFETARQKIAAIDRGTGQGGAELMGEAVREDNDNASEIKENFETTLGIPVSDGAYKILERERFDADLANLIIEVIEKILENGVVSNKEMLLKEGDAGIALRTVGTDDEKTVKNLRRFYGLDQAKTMVRVVAQPLVKDLNYTLVNLLVDFSQRLIQPNITLNRNETEARKKEAMESVKPIFYKIKSGEMLLREGERVTEMQLLKLGALRSQNRMEKVYARTVGALLIVFALILSAFFLHVRQSGKRILKSNKDVMFVSSVLLIFFLIPDAARILFESLASNTPFTVSESALFFGVPLAASAMTISLFLGFEIAVFFSVVIAASTAIIFHGRFEVFVYFFVNGVMAAYWTQSCRERKVFIKAGLQVGALNIVLATILSIYMGDIGGFRLLWNWLLAFTGGIGSGIITAGIVPLLEVAFRYTTDITLLELANLERPILRKLMMEAPGTYHHSVVVGSMVEAAASEIGANPLLAKVCGYYHDIGKIRKPIYFIENQTSQENRHDKLAPSMSSLILISHVKEGVEIARKHKLGTEIKDAIRQHHGTSIITYFYEKAKRLKGEDAVKLEDFRYPGPRPQTREIALVMLADVVEAASRTLSNPTPARIQGLVKTLINKIFDDGQLDNCELTLKDLHAIANCFNKILNGIHHHRIEYPEATEKKNGKERNGSTDHQPANPSPDLRRDPSENGPNGLKRAGVS